jgi:hypothetical protein
MIGVWRIGVCAFCAQMPASFHHQPAYLIAVCIGLYSLKTGYNFNLQFTAVFEV